MKSQVPFTFMLQHVHAISRSHVLTFSRSHDHTITRSRVGIQNIHLRLNNGNKAKRQKGNKGSGAAGPDD